MRPTDALLALALLLVPAALAAPPATPGPAADDSAAVDAWQRVLPGVQLTYPRDHGAHLEHRTEWWYLTGQLEAEGGRRLGFQFTVFRRGLGDVPHLLEPGSLRATQVLAGHLAVTDVESGRTLFAERLRRLSSPLAEAAEDDLRVRVEGWSLERRPDDRLLLVARDARQGLALDLELTPEKPLVLHGTGGHSLKGSDPTNASAYASWTRLATRGSVEVGGRRLAVTGASWFDHEYGSSVLEEGVVGWDWFGLQLEDGRELMLFQLRGADEATAPTFAGTLVEHDGTARTLDPSDLRLEACARWTSPRTGATYPAAWALDVPSAGLELLVRPLVADCELVTERSTGVAYWEGPVEVRGGARGRGYAELTGYASSMQGRL